MQRKRIVVNSAWPANVPTPLPVFQEGVRPVTFKVLVERGAYQRACAFVWLLEEGEGENDGGHVAGGKQRTVSEKDKRNTSGRTYLLLTFCTLRPLVRPRPNMSSRAFPDLYESVRKSQS